MRILLVTSMVPDRQGAGAIPVLLHAQLEALRSRHEITLVTGIGDEVGEEQAAAALIDAGVEAHFGDRRRPLSASGRRRRRLELASRWGAGEWPWRSVWFATPAVQSVLDKLAASRTFDVVAVEDSAMAMLRFPQGAPCVLTEHEVRRPRPPVWRPGPPRSWPGWAFRELDWSRWEGFQRTAWRRFDRIQVFTDRDAQVITETAPEVSSRVRVNPFGLMLPPEPDPAREEPSSLLFVGNFTHAPNREAALWLAREIMPKVNARHPGARLRIIGSSVPSEIFALSGPRVEVLADVERVDPYIEAAAVILAPVRSGGGMRMKVLYALASGKPVVTTPRGAEGLTVRARTAPLVIAADAHEIAEVTAQLLADEPRRRELGRQGRAFACAHHSPGAWARRLETVYDEARRDGRDQRRP